MAFAMPMLAIVVFLAMLFAMPLAMARLVLGHIHLIVPAVAHEIDRPAAGIIFGAVLIPVFLVPGRDMKVDWLINNSDRRGLNHDGFCVYDFRPGIVPNVDVAIKARLADTDGDTDIGSAC